MLRLRQPRYTETRTRRAGVLRRPQVDPVGTTLDQYLGQLRIAVKMRQRDGKQLSAYLHAGLPLGRGFGFGRECPKAASGDTGKVIRAL